MIFVAVGTQKFPFNRLLKLIDEWVEESGYKGKIFAQTGYSDYLPKNYHFQPFLDKTEFDHYISTCDILITHSGIATILAGLSSQKPVLVVPRLKKYGEHVDDHQLEIANSFSEMNYILMYTEDTTLEPYIKELFCHTFEPYISSRQKALDIIQDFLSEL